MELGLGDFVEVSYADEGGQDHLGIMEINELFEDSQVTVDLQSHWAHKLLPALLLQAYICCTFVFSSSGLSSQQTVLFDTCFTARGVLAATARLQSSFFAVDGPGTYLCWGVSFSSIADKPSLLLQT